VLFSKDFGSVQGLSGRFLLLGWHGLELILAIAIEPEKELVVLPEGVSMRDCDHSYPEALHVRIQVTLHVHADGTCALIKNCILWSVVNKSGHGDTLLLATRKHIIPVRLSIPAAFSADQVSQTHLSQYTL
jgi:hypothetical protein